MHNNRVSFTSAGAATPDNEATTDAISSLLSAWRMSGQICGREWPLVQFAGGWWCIALTPELDSLHQRFDSRDVSQTLGRIAKAGLAMKWEPLGDDPGSADACACASPRAYALFTTYISLESPVRCLDCFRPVGLHRFKPEDGGEHYRVIGWQSDYQSCDSLQMNCGVLEEAATLELSNLDSSLTRSGREQCDVLSASSGRPFYYYLYRANGASREAELESRCPGCGNTWALEARLHLFDFKCDSCRLLSNVAFSLES